MGPLNKANSKKLIKSPWCLPLAITTLSVKEQHSKYSALQICPYVHTYTRTDRYANTHVHIHKCTSTHICKHTPTHTRLYIYNHTYMQIHIDTHIPIYVSTHIYAYISSNICKHMCMHNTNVHRHTCRHVK